LEIRFVVKCQILQFGSTKSHLVTLASVSSVPLRSTTTTVRANFVGMEKGSDVQLEWEKNGRRSGMAKECEKKWSGKTVRGEIFAQ